MEAIDEIKRHDLRQYLIDQGFKFAGNKTLCPFHNDTNPSLDVAQKNGAWVFHCFGCEAGGSIIDFVAKHDGCSTAEAIRKLKKYYGINDQPQPKQKPRKVAEYPYADESGKLLYKIIRYKPKDFRADRKMDGIRRVPYRWPEVMKASTVWLLEGEKDADNARELGITATTFPFGVDTWKREFAEFFKGKDVRICLDKGTEKEAERRAKDLQGIAKSVKIIELPGLDKDGQDVSDWIELQDSKTNDELKEWLGNIAEKTPEYEPVGNGIRVKNSFLSQYVNSVSSVTDAPELFILFSGLALLSGVLNKFYFNYPRRTSLNLYILLLAPSTYYRKSVTVDIAADYLSAVNPDLIFPESFTTEALLEILSEQNRGLLRWSELIQVKEFQFGSDYNRGLPSLLTDLFDYKENVKRWTKAGKIEIKEPIITILAAGISDWLVQGLKQVDFQGGIWTRFIFVPAPEEERKFRLPKEFSLDPEIKKRLKKLDLMQPAKMNLTKILPLMEKWGQKHMSQTLKLQNDILQANFQRLEIMLLKIACILQLAENQSFTVEPETFHEAVQIIEYLKRILPPFFDEEIRFTPFEKGIVKVKKYIKKENITNKSKILKYANIDADLAGKVLKQLLAEGEIERTNRPQTGRGRRGEYYKYTGEKL